jgi:hypothetical protein
MNTLPKRRAASEHGTSLIELLVYMALFVVVVGFATAAFFDCWSSTKILHRDADDIARALDIGERWRADVRGATGVVQSIVVNGAEQLRVPTATGEVTYIFANGTIRRRDGSAGPDTLWLSDVKSSQMKAGARGRVTAWRWELELKSARKEGRMQPLFTFECAAGPATIQ